ncbi:MAG: hypothetical protein JST54_08320 [Deltaproteobacteria bacterium]|nr:hypothetical protein [Deltaproteobacteria bacterium]
MRFLAFVACLTFAGLAHADEVRAKLDPDPPRLFTVRGSFMTGTPSWADVDLSIDIARPLFVELDAMHLETWGGSALAGWRTLVVDHRNARGRGETVDAQLAGGVISLGQHAASTPPQSPSAQMSDVVQPATAQLPGRAEVKAATGVRALAAVESLFWVAPHLGFGLRAQAGFSAFPGRHLVFGYDAGEAPTPLGAIAPELRLSGSVAF